MDCETFRGWIYHLQADEIPEKERGDFEGHLDDCPDCARLLEVEQGFLDALKGRLARQEAPPGLETRVRAALRAEAPDAPRVAWYRTPWFAATAAALLLVVILIPSLPTAPPGPTVGSGAPGQVTHVVAQDVVVVDLDCDRAGMSLEYQRDCDHPHHVNALKTADGRYWHISPDQRGYGRLVTDPEMRGRRMVIDGDYYPAINTVHIDSSRLSARAIL